MSEIELIIKIPNKLYEECKRLGDSRDTLFEAIRNGTPMPKGHGRLIDADKLNDLMKFEVSDGINEYGCLMLVKQAPTIIEANKERE